MGILLWALFGLIAGAIAKFIMPGKQGGGIIITIVLGIVGAIVGGFIFSAVGSTGVTGLNLWSMFVAVVGAVVVLLVYHAVMGRRTI